MKKLLAAVAMLLPMLAPQAATYILNTGLSPTPCNDFCIGGSLSPQRGVAVKFSTLEDVVIGSIETHMKVGKAGTFSFGISTDNGRQWYDFDNKPDRPLFGQSFYLPVGTPVSGSENPTRFHDDYSWQGVYNLNWELPAGTYWATFEGVSGNALISADAIGGGEGETMGGPNGWDNVWISGMRLPVRVATYEAVSSVPEPETYTLFAAGLALVGFALRRRKNHG